MKKRDVLFAGLALFVIWQIAAWIMNKSILPAPWIVIQVFFEELFNGNMLEHVLSSLWRVMASMFLSVVMAAPLGLMLGQSQRLNRFFPP